MNWAVINMEEEMSSRKISAPTGKREAEEELDEGMDKFHALLGNLRAMKELFRLQHGDAGGGGRTSSKRLRRMEEETPPPPPPPSPSPSPPPWIPTFQLEDFKHPSGEEKEEEEEGKLRKDKENYTEQGLEDGASLDLSLAL